MKVVAYVVRDGRILTFRHRDHPEAGLQVPAGTLEEGEDPEHAVIREAEEETGRRGFAVVRKLGTQEWHFTEPGQVPVGHEPQLRHVFHLSAPADLPEHWSHFAEEVSGGYWFELSWTPLNQCRDLAAGQGALLERL